MGHPAMDLKYRFQWTFPIIVSHAQPERGVRGLERRAQDDERRQELDGDLARSHVPRSRDARQLGRSDHEGPDVDRVLRHDLHHRGVARHAERDLDGLGRRQGLRHAERRREVDRRHAEGHGEVHARVEHRRVAASASASRTSRRIAFSWTTTRRISGRRRDCGAHWTRIDAGIAAERVHARRARRSRQARPAHRRHRARRLVSRPTMARTGRACGSTCRSSRCTTSSSRKATSCSRRTAAASTSWTTSRRSSR